MSTKVGILNLDSIFSVFYGLYEKIKYGVFFNVFMHFFVLERWLYWSVTAKMNAQ